MELQATQTIRKGKRKLIMINGRIHLAYFGPIEYAWLVYLICDISPELIRELRNVNIMLC